MTEHEKIDEMYRMMMAREGRDAVYRERLDNHLLNHRNFFKCLAWLISGSGLVGILVTLIF